MKFDNKRVTWTCKSQMVGHISSTIMGSTIKLYSKGCESKMEWVCGGLFIVRVGLLWRGGEPLVTLRGHEGVF